MALIDIFPLHSLLPMVIHLELASHDSAPFSTWIQLLDQELQIYVTIPLPPRKDFIVFWFDAGIDIIWLWLTGQGCGALGAVVQW